MKILIHTYDTAYQNSAGGVHTRIDKFVCALRDLGMTVDYFDKYKTKVSQYDILYVFKLDISSKRLIDYAKSVGLKIVISPIIAIDKGWVVDLYWLLKKLPVATIYRQSFSICKNIDMMIVETPKEGRFLSRYYRVDKSKIHVIPNGVDDLYTKSKLIYSKIPTEDYSIVVARFDKNKNQLNLIRALKNQNINVVFIGGAAPSCPEYYNNCVKEAKDAHNIFFLGWLDSKSELFRSALSNAKILICPSFQETFGLSILEGMTVGATPVLSKTLPILEYDLFKDCVTFSPWDTFEIRKAVFFALSNKERPDYRYLLQNNFSWRFIAEKHLNLYNELLSKNLK